MQLDVGSEPTFRYAHTTCFNLYFGKVYTPCIKAQKAQPSKIAEIWIIFWSEFCSSHKGMHGWMHRQMQNTPLYLLPPIHLELEPKVLVWVGLDTSSGSIVGGFPGHWAGLGHITLSMGTTRSEYSTILQWTQKSSKSGYTQCSHKKIRVYKNI